MKARLCLKAKLHALSNMHNRRRRASVRRCRQRRHSRAVLTMTLVTNHAQTETKTLAEAQEADALVEDWSARQEVQDVR